SNAFNAFSKSCWFMYATPMLLRRDASWGLVDGAAAASSVMSRAKRQVETRAILRVLVIGGLGMILSEWLVCVRVLRPCMPNRIVRTSCEVHRNSYGYGVPSAPLRAGSSTTQVIRLANGLLRSG